MRLEQKYREVSLIHFLHVSLRSQKTTLNMKYDFQRPLLLTTVLFLTVEQSLTPSAGNAKAGTTLRSIVEKSWL